MTPPSSMTGFARSEGAPDGFAWAWELRSVNGRGLDLRFRLPSGLESLEAGFREAAGKVLKRGNVTANLTARRDDAVKLAVDTTVLNQLLALALEVAGRIPGSEPPRAETLLGLPGVLRPSPIVEDTDVATRQAEAVRSGFAAVLDGLVAARRAEGARLAAILAGLLAEVAALRERAVVEAMEQPTLQRARMLETLQGLLPEPHPAGTVIPEERIAQEIALLAAKSDVREELDRLDSHLQAARALLRGSGAIGRRFEFLVQEFNREANTLCSKSASIALTTSGLQLKAAIEQLREQVQNIE